MQACSIQAVTLSDKPNYISSTPFSAGTKNHVSQKSVNIFREESPIVRSLYALNVKNG